MRQEQEGEEEEESQAASENRAVSCVLQSFHHTLGLMSAKENFKLVRKRTSNFHVHSTPLSAETRGQAQGMVIILHMHRVPI